MRGGYRKGAGRKKGFAAKSAEEARRLLSERVAQEIGMIADTLFSKAKKGDIRAIKELLDRSWGRPLFSAEVKYATPAPVLTEEQMYRLAKRMVNQHEASQKEFQETI